MVKNDYKAKANEVYSMPTGVGDLKTRLENVDEVLSDHYFENYIDNSYNANLTASDPLSSENKNFKLLERMADYIIMSDEGKELNKQDKENRAITTEYLDKKINREHFSGFEQIGMNGKNDIPMNDENWKDPYMLSKTEINDNDIQHEAINEYQKLYNGIDNVGRFTKRYRDFIKHEVMSDMISVKNSVNQTPTKKNKGYAMSNSNPKSNNDFNFFDFTNPNTVKEMLSISNVNLNTQYNLYLATLDFRELVNRANLNEEELFLFNVLQQGYKFSQFQSEFGINEIHYRKVVRKNLINKIIALGETYDASDDKSIIFKRK